jgi:hypothetical protein
VLAGEFKERTKREEKSYLWAGVSEILNWTPQNQKLQILITALGKFLAGSGTC